MLESKAPNGLDQRSRGQGWLAHIEAVKVVPSPSRGRTIPKWGLMVRTTALRLLLRLSRAPPSYSSDPISLGAKTMRLLKINLKNCESVCTERKRQL